MAELLYLDNPADQTVTFMGHTLTYWYIDLCRQHGISPWTWMPSTFDG